MFYILAPTTALVLLLAIVPRYTVVVEDTCPDFDFDFDNYSTWISLTVILILEYSGTSLIQPFFITAFLAIIKWSAYHVEEAFSKHTIQLFIGALHPRDNQSLFYC